VVALTEHIASRPRARTARRSRLHRLLGGGTDGNEQLTAVVGVILLVLLAVLGVTIVFIGNGKMLWLHLFLGVLLVGPVALKLASTGYRFVRYYTSSPAYRRKGPPHPLMRMLGPFVVLSTIGVFLTGLVLLLEGPGAGNLVRELHKLTFIAWLAVVGIHVLWHLAELPRGVRAVRNAEGRSRDLPGSSGRGILIVAAMAAGLALALVFLPDIHAWTSGLAFNPHLHLNIGGGG
jgi:hypothetical protein